MTEMRAGTRSYPERLPGLLLVLRLSCAVFFLQWGVEKLVDPDRTVRIFAYFYFSEIPSQIVPAMGILQLLLVAAFAMGYRKTLSYGAFLVMHTMSVLVTWRELLHPFEPDTHNHVFLTAAPVLAALWLLFSLREHDTLMAVDALRAQSGSAP